MTDTPIYDEMQWEFRSANSPIDEQPRSANSGSRRQDGSRRQVSVWALLDEHRRRS
ncbi:MAG TPA: hypothetical protein VFV67_27580 [Actinophytocola sp.]|uniref:hypothetical protein n=1 Tax=Actinophytocola sp. TaxID=1872138 RepID=UPI002DBFB29B|nr:hypothetical protein [Actinophytocola sp.]HEU5474426.1 hypothetical protein [Actinophytocola sp.]